MTEDGIIVGKLRDLIFRYTDVPVITKLTIRSLHLKDINIPIEYLIRFDKEVIITKKYETIDVLENELYLDKNVTDKQIIDIAGSKVVRANDALIQEKSKKYVLLGVDIGIRGILRWFGLAQSFKKFFKQSILPWSDIQPLEIPQGKIVLNIEQEKLKNLHPEDLADYLESTNIKNVINIISSLDRQFASEVVAELNLNYQSSLLKKLSLEKTAKLIELMDPDEAVDVLMEFTAKRRNTILGKMEPHSSKQIEALLKYGDTSVGKYITNDFITVKSSTTAAKVTALLKQSADIPNVNYVYVVNDQNQLIGVFNLHELILQMPTVPVYKFMNQNMLVVHLKTALNIVLRKLIKYKLSSIPVIDQQKHMLGVVTIDDISEVFIEKI